MIAHAALPRPSRLRWNLVASVVGNTVFALGGWLILSLLTRLTDAATVGQYVLALAITAPLFLFSNLQLREVQATDHATNLPFGAYLRVRILTSAAALAVAGVIALAYDGPTRLIILLTAAAKALDAVVDIVYGDWLRQERQSRVAVSLALRGVTAALFMGIVLACTRSLLIASVASMIQSGLGLAHALLSREKGEVSSSGAVSTTARKVGFEWSRLAALVPLGLAAAFDSLSINVPRYFVEQHHGMAAVGVFGAIGAFMQLGGATVAVGLSQVGLPRLSRLFAAGDARGYLRLIQRLLLAGIGLGLAGLAVSLFAGKALLTAALGPSYAPYTALLNWTMLNALVWYVGGILAYSVTATRNFRVQFPVFGAGIAAVSATAFLLVPHYGLEGAAASILAGFVVRAVANGLLVLRAIRSL